MSLSSLRPTLMALIAAAILLPSWSLSPTPLAAQNSIAPDAAETQASALDQAKAHFRAQRFAEGEQVLQQFVRTQPNHADTDEARFLIGRAQVRQERLDDARRSFEWIVNSDPLSEWAARALENLALLSDRSRNATAALDARRRLLRDHPESPTTARVWLEIADTNFRAERYKEAAEIFGKFESTLDEKQRTRHTVASVLAGNLDNPDIVLENLVETLRGGRVETALALARALQRRFPRHPAAHEAAVREAQCLVAQGGRELSEEARRIFLQVANNRSAPRDAVELARWELIRVNAGPLADVNEALKWCDLVIASSNRGEFRHQQAKYSKAWLLWAHKRFEDSLTAFEAFAAAYPEQGTSAPIQGYMEDCRIGEHRSVLRP